MRIGYFADGPWAHRALAQIVADERFKIQFICGRFDRIDEDLREQAKSLRIPYLRHENVNSTISLKELGSFECDIFVSMSFNQIFRSDFLNIPPLGTINCHAGKLPFYRGRNVLNWVLINDEIEFGVTVHYVDEGVDTGDIILQQTFPINDRDNYGSLLSRAYIACADLLFEALKQINSGIIQRTSQESIHPIGFYCPIRRNGDELIQWSSTSREIFNFTRALSTPGPIARTWLGLNEVAIISTKMINEYPSHKGVPGSVIGQSKAGFIVKTSDSAILVEDWISNIKIKLGDRLK